MEPLRASTHEVAVADCGDHLRVTLTGYADFYSAAERGLHQIRFFTDEATALAWLRAAPAEPLSS